MPKIEARTKLFAKLREVFRRRVSQPLTEVIVVINPILRGWLNYYRIGHASKVFKYTRQWVLEKVRRHLMRAKGRRGFGWKRWNNEGLVAMYNIYDDYRVTSGKVLPAR